jgi:hypothetical protein
MKRNVFLSLVIGLCLITLPAHATVYHIDPSAAKSGNGSALSPFKVWSDLPAMNGGDDVFFKCGTTLYPNNPLIVKWSGTQSNPVEIGAYFLSGSKPIYGVNGARPIISGSGYTVPENYCFASSDSWRGLIDVSSKDYVHIKDLHIFQSGFMGILISGNTKTGSNSKNFLIRNVKVEGSYWQGILVNHNPYNYGIIEDSEVTGAAYAWDQGCTKGFTGALTVANTPFSYTTIRRNYVHKNWGEGIGSNRIPCSSETDHSGYATIEDNVVFNNRRVDIYADRTEHNVIRRNMLLGAKDPEFRSAKSDDRTWNQYGIWINVEHADSRGECPDVSHDNSIYNNMVAGHYVGIGVASDYTSGTMRNNVFYNNTAIANRINYSVGGKLAGYTTDNIIFKNNISYCPPNTACQDVSSDPSWFDNRITADNNAWTKKPNNWGGPNDIETNDKWTKIYGWQDLKEVVKASDFMPTKGNPVIGKGAELPSPIDEAISMNSTNISTSPLFISVGVLVQSEKQDPKWDMGAVPFQGYILAPTLSIGFN